MALTPSGLEKLRRIEEQRVAILPEYLPDWSEEDTGQMAQALLKLSASLKHAAPAKGGWDHRNKAAGH